MKVLLRCLQISLVTALCAAQQVTAPQGSISGSVKDQTGAAIAAGTVTLSTEGTAEKRVEAIKDGEYQFLQVSAGSYDLLFEAPKDINPTREAGIKVASGQNLHLDVRMIGPDADPIVKPESSGIAKFWTLVMVFGYLFSILITRWYKIAKPSRNFLVGHIDALHSDLAAHRYLVRGDRIRKLQAQLGHIRRDCEHPPRIFRQFLFWSQSAENAAWKAVHEVERELAAYLSPPAAVHTSLIYTAAKLRALQGTEAQQIANAMDTELKAARPNEAYRSHLLASATSMVYEQRDANLISLMEWQNKAMWLILVSCLMLVLLSLAAGNAILFLAGAAGGMLSRLMRSLKSSDVPVDYGASWTTLFLSPLFGAFCGWFGIGIVVLLANRSVALLGGLFTQVTWPDALRLSTLTIAFLLGFSERLFDSLVSAVEQQAEKGAAGGTKDQSPAASSVSSILAATAPAPPSNYDVLRPKIAAATNGSAADRAKVVAFLVAMGQEAAAGSTPQALQALLLKVEGLVGSDASRQARYAAEAVRAGFSVS